MLINNDQIKKLIEAIEQYETIIIHRHVNPDPDAFGSQLGLQEVIRYNYPSKKVLAAGTMSKGLEWMGEMDKVSKEDYQGALVIITDTANTERIDGSRYNLGDKLIKIDHHPLVDSYGDLEIVNTEASSCSELICALILQSHSKLEMNSHAAELFYTGIVGDTGRFMFDNTTAETFHIASLLLSKGINHFRINTLLNNMSMEMLKFQSYLIDHMVVTSKNVAYTIVSQAVLKEYQVSEEESNQFVNFPSVLEDVYAWVMVVEQEDSDEWRLRIRSKGPTINQLAAKYHGGGHPKASGGKAFSNEEINQFIEDLEELTQIYLASKN